MAFSSNGARVKQRRQEERQRQREEDRRQAELERRLEEECEREREEERRQKALRQSQEFEAANEARAAFLVRFRQQKRAERRSMEQKQDRRDILRQLLCAANRLERNEERNEAELESMRGAESKRKSAKQRQIERKQNEVESLRREAARQAQQQELRETQRQEKQNAENEAERRSATRVARREEKCNAEREVEQAEALRQYKRLVKFAEQREVTRSAQIREAQQERQRQQEQRLSHATNQLLDRIPSGSISGSLPWLRVSGNRVVDLDSVHVRLRGVNLPGLDSSPVDSELGFAAGAGITRETIDTVLSWGTNVIRVAINQQRVLKGSGVLSGWDYLADLDWIIRHAAEGGAYTMLSLRRLDESTVFGTLPGANAERLPNVIAPQPDYDTVGMWRLIGERYSDEPAVLFDLYTSPHSALVDDLTGFDTDWDLWTLWVRMIVAELRRQHPRALCFVSGLNWAADLSGLPIVGTEGQPIPNLVYSAHVYPRRDTPLAAICALSRSHPVFVTEWGGWQSDISWGERTAMVLRDVVAGWTAAHWNAEPPLIQASGSRLAPTAFGAVVRRELAMAGDRELRR